MGSYPEVNQAVMTSMEETFMLLLRKGKVNAISARVLARKTGINSRTIRDIIHRLRMVFDKPIRSNPGKPADFFIAVTQEELIEVSDRWIRFGVKNLAMAWKLRKQSLRKYTRQISIALEEELNIDSGS